MGAAAHVLDAADLPDPPANAAAAGSERAELHVSVRVPGSACVGDGVAVRLGGPAAGRADCVGDEVCAGEGGDQGYCDESS